MTIDQIPPIPGTTPTKATGPAPKTSAGTGSDSGRSAAPSPAAENIFQHILQEDPEGGFTTLALAVFSGLVMSQFIVLIGVLTIEVRADTILTSSLIWLVVFMVLAIGTQYWAMLRAIETTERCLFNMLRRLATRLGATSLETLEQEGGEGLFAAISLEGTTISNATLLAMHTLQNLSVFAGASVYILVSAPRVMAWLILFAVAWYVLHTLILKKVRQHHTQAMVREEQFNATLRELTEGFRELVAHPRKIRDIITGTLEPEARRSRDRHLLAASHFTLLLRAQGMTWLLALVFLAFILPRFGLPNAVIIPFFVVAYLWIPTAEAVITASTLIRAGISIDKMRTLEARLQPESLPADPLSLPEGFQTLTLRQVRYHYPTVHGERGFGIGPIDLEIRAGEILFVTGGNGSGKSTLIKLLTGLYPAQGGQLEVDGEVLPLTAHRALFSYIPTDYHLFDALYGLPPEALADGDAFLERLGLASDVQIADGRFTTTDLSSGQRKRLGLAVAYMERRPIVVLDEWAADQDPYYRRLFYEDLVEHFRSRGQTVIAASHDDHFFDRADRLIKMADGQIVDATK